MASSRRTYDTDSITLRTVFAKNPGNSNVPALRVLTADGAGGTYWAIPSSLGVNPSFNQITTSAATYTADLSYNKFRLLAGENIGMVDGPSGSNTTTLFAKAFSQLDVSGGNILSAFSDNQLDSSVLLAGENGILLRADPGTNTLFIGGSGASNTTISTGIYGFSELKVTSSASTITSSVLTWGGDFLTSSSPSSLLRLIGFNDIQLSTNVTTNSVFFTISTFTSQGYLNISNAAYSAGPSTLSTVSSLYVTSSFFGSTFNSLSSASGVNLSSIYSTINGAAISSGIEILTLQGLVNARATIVQLNNDIADVNSNIASTVIGLGSVGYISTAGGGSGDVTKANLLSTVAGLGTVDYVSTLSLYSTLSSFSTALGAVGTGSGDVTKANLLSTVAGLGTSGYISSLSTITTSTIFNTGAISTYSLEVFGSNTLTNSGSTILRGAIYLQGPLFVASSVTGASDTIINATNLVSTTLGLQTSGFISTANLTNLVSTANLSNLVSTANLTDLVSTANLSNLVSTANLAALVSTTFLDTQLASTVTGLGNAGYLSSPNSLSISTGTIQTSTVNFKDTANGEIKTLNSSNNALYFNGSLVGSGSVINNFNTSTYVYQVSSVSTIFAYDSVVISSATNVFLSPEFVSTVFFSTGALQTSTVELKDTQTGTIQLLAVKNGQLQLNGTAIQGDVTSANLVSTTLGLQTSGFISTANLTNLVSTANLTNLVSTANLTNLVSTANLTNLVSTANLTSLVSTANLTNLVSTANLTSLVSTANLTSLVSTANLTNLVSTANLANLVSTANLSDLISSPNLTSSISGLGYVAVTNLIEGTGITITAGAPGSFTIAATGGGGGGITTENLVSTTFGLQTSGFVSTANLTNLVSTANLTNLVSTANLTNLVSTANLTDLVSTANLTNLVSTANLTNLVSTANLTNLISTVNLTSTIAGLSNIVVTKLIAGDNITLTPAGGQGEVIIDAAGGGGGGITTENLTSTVAGLGFSFSTNSIVLSSSMSNYQLTTSTNTITEQPYLWMNDRIYGTYNPVTVVVSTLGDTDLDIFERDIGKYFLFSQANVSRTINFPVVNSSLNGWNVVIKNMPESTYSFTVNTSGAPQIAPGVATTVVCDGGTFYSL
jgi:hypothetical protein